VTTEAKVIVVMGSDSDLPIVEETINALDQMEVPFEVHVISAHRSPDALEELVREARSGAAQVIIAVAGGSAHLAGALAARTALPVIGVPVPTDVMGGVDSLLSTVQMPSGVPVACMGLGASGARNAAVLAAQILAAAQPRYREVLYRLKERQARQVEHQDQNVQQWLKDRRQAQR